MSYSCGRLWIEGLRIDPLCLMGLRCTAPVGHGWRRSSALIALGGLGLYWLYGRKRALPDPSGVTP